MAVPAALAQVHLATGELQRCVIGGVRPHPLEFTQVGADYRGHQGGTGRRLDEGENALGYEREEEEADTGHQRDKARVHRTGTATGLTLSAGCEIAVIIMLMTSSDMPVSMLMPETVRTNQYGLIRNTV